MSGVCGMPFLRSESVARQKLQKCFPFGPVSPRIVLCDIQSPPTVTVQLSTCSGFDEVVILLCPWLLQSLQSSLMVVFSSGLAIPKFFNFWKVLDSLFFDLFAGSVVVGMDGAGKQRFSICAATANRDEITGTKTVCMLLYVSSP